MISYFVYEKVSQVKVYQLFFCVASTTCTQSLFVADGYQARNSTSTEFTIYLFPFALHGIIPPSLPPSPPSLPPSLSLPLLFAGGSSQDPCLSAEGATIRMLCA